MPQRWHTVGHRDFCPIAKRKSAGNPLAADRAAFLAWLGRPLNAFLTILLLMAAFRHTALGLQVVIEDYVHSALRLPLLIATHLLCCAICVAGILATLSIVFAR